MISRSVLVFFVAAFLALAAVVVPTNPLAASAQDNEPDYEATIAALQTRVAELEAQVATPEVTPSPVPSPTPTAAAEFGTIDNPQNVGRSVTSGCVKLRLFSAQVQQQTGGFAGVAEPGSKYIILDFELANECKVGSIDYNVNNFFAQDTGNGVTFTDVTATFDMAPAIQFGTIDPGRKVRGFVVIKINEDTRRVVVGYKVDFSGKQTIYFEINTRS